MRKNPLTFDELQVKRRRFSVALFVLLALFYYLSILVIWLIGRVAFLLYFGGFFYRPPSAAELVVMLIAPIFLAVTHWAGTVADGPDRIVSSLGAAAPDPEDRYHRQFTDVVEELKIAAGLEAVTPKVIPISALNAFSVTDLQGRSVVGVTEGLLSRLTRRQLQGVVAHELAHIREGDNFVVTMSCSLFAILAQILSDIAPTVPRDWKRQGGGGGLFFRGLLTPVIYLLSAGAYLLNSLISRQRESLADATATELTRDPLALAEALYKIERNWRGAGFAREELAPLFIVNPAVLRLDEQEGWAADLFSTHPPIRRRIRMLLGMAHQGLSVIDERIREEEQASVAPPASADPGATGGAMPVPIDLQPASGTGPAPAAVAGARVSTGRCPECNIPLHGREYEGVLIEGCPSCHGTLVRQDRVWRILNRGRQVFSAELERKAAELVDPGRLRPARKENCLGGPLAVLRCPGCGGHMLRGIYNYQFFIEVDRCLNCRLVWFDNEELELLQAMVRQLRRS